MFCRAFRMQDLCLAKPAPQSDCRRALRCDRRMRGRVLTNGGTGQRCGRNLSGGRRSRCCLPLPAPLAAQTQSVQQPGSITVTDRAPGPDQIVAFSADAGHLRQRRGRRHGHLARCGWRATAIISPPTRSSGTARPARSGPQGNVVLLTPRRRQARRRGRRADRHAPRRHREQSLGRARKRRPHRRPARHAEGRGHDPRECDLLALPGYDRDADARSGRAGRSPQHG